MKKPLSDKRHSKDSFIIRLRRAWKSYFCSEFYSCYFSRPGAVFLVGLLSYTPVTPNQITLLMGIFGLLGGFLFCFGTTWSFLIGGCCFILLNILDCADGNLARFTGRTSSIGDYLDRIVHYVTDSAFILGIGVGLFRQYGILTLLLLAIILEIIALTNGLLRDLLITCRIVTVSDSNERKKVALTTSGRRGKILKWFINLFCINISFFHIIVICAIFDIVWDVPFTILGISGTFVLLYFLFYFITQNIKVFIRLRNIYIIYIIPKMNKLR